MLHFILCNIFYVLIVYWYCCSFLLWICEIVGEITLFYMYFVYFAAQLWKNSTILQHLAQLQWYWWLMGQREKNNTILWWWQNQFLGGCSTRQFQWPWYGELLIFTVAGAVVCLEQGANDLHMVQLMQLTRHYSLIQAEWLVLLVRPSRVVVEDC